MNQLDNDRMQVASWNAFPRDTKISEEKRQAFIKGARWQYEQMQPLMDRMKEAFAILHRLHVLYDEGFLHDDTDIELYHIVCDSEPWLDWAEQSLKEYGERQ